MSYESSLDKNTSVHSRVISAVFDTAGAARAAVDDLVAAGIPRQQITQTNSDTAGEPVTGTAPANRDRGLWEELKDLFLPDEDHAVYAEGLRRGGYLVAARIDEANYNKALEILDRDGAVDLDERQAQWRSEGWTGFASTGGQQAASQAERRDTTTTAGVGMPYGERTTDLSATRTAQTSTGIAGASTGPAVTGAASNYREDDAARAAALGTAAAGTRASGETEVIPVMEEQLRIGKRDVSHGRVRLRSYVVETPVSEQVRLRDETVSIDRRPVDRPVGPGDTAFQERTIEAEERRQEAVVSKEARVTEEITLRKSAQERVENVSDTVRSTKVDIDDGRGAGGGGTARFAAATDASRIVEHMAVISADGQNIGTVDHLDGPDRIKLAKNTSPDHQHHYVPFTWIDHVDQHVHLKRTLAEIKADASTRSS